MAPVPVPTTRDPTATRGQLERWLASIRPDQGAVEVTLLGMPRQGLSSETILFDATWSERVGPPGRYVARVRPTGYSLFMEHDLEMQQLVLRALGPVPGIPVPEVIGYADEATSPLGAPFFVMERIEGQAPRDHPPYTRAGWLFEARPEERRRLYDRSFDILTRIHQVDWRAAGLDFMLERPDTQGGVAGQLARDGAMLEWVAQGRTLEQFDEVHRWLRAYHPPPADPTLNWGDARLGNILYRDFEPVAVLDWEMATIAPPEMDLGWWLGIERNFTVGFGERQPAGFPSEAEVIERFEERLGRQVVGFDFYRVWGSFRIALLIFRLNDMMVERGIIPAGSPEGAHLPAMRALAAVTG
jgi:aminoglycoside phosphotransferase (APT) family kinase protein